MLHQQPLQASACCEDSIVDLHLRLPSPAVRGWMGGRRRHGTPAPAASQTPHHTAGTFPAQKQRPAAPPAAAAALAPVPASAPKVAVLSLPDAWCCGCTYGATYGPGPARVKAVGGVHFVRKTEGLGSHPCQVQSPQGCRGGRSARRRCCWPHGRGWRGVPRSAVCAGYCAALGWQ